MSGQEGTVGALLQDWRRRRRLSQLHLSAEAGVSQRHLSFVESGRAAPSRAMVLRLAEHLAVPARERNRLLAAAGFAPVYRDRPLDDPDMAMARQAVDAILAGHMPYPALAVDRHWHLVSANESVHRLLAGVDPRLLAPPVNVLRLSLHPDGLAPQLDNYRQWRDHVRARLTRQADATGDAGLADLLAEIASYPAPAGARPHRSGTPEPLAGIAVPFDLRTEDGLLSFLTATTVFGTALDITLSEIAIESFFPADPATRAAMHRLAGP